MNNEATHFDEILDLQAEIRENNNDFASEKIKLKNARADARASFRRMLVRFTPQMIMIPAGLWLAHSLNSEWLQNRPLLDQVKYKKVITVDDAGFPQNTFILSKDFPKDKSAQTLYLFEEFCIREFKSIENFQNDTKLKALGGNMNINNGKHVPYLSGVGAICFIFVSFMLSHGPLGAGKKVTTHRNQRRNVRGAKAALRQFKKRRKELDAQLSAAKQPAKNRQ
ncbi:MAG: hypothetical protein FWF34_02970 [Alphaproteobacteria bacterium]|nr:hypothetical protein [Alphaproteobacteria bacterium]MCL2890193.1 hypothetical protein [Alphaproteobacteria bacterium]